MRRHSNRSSPLPNTLSFSPTEDTTAAMTGPMTSTASPRLRPGTRLPSWRPCHNGKKLVCRKRHIAVDILGLLLAVLVTDANATDAYGGRKLLDAVHTNYPTVRTALVDGGYRESLIAHDAKLGITVIKVMRNPQAKGFEVIPKRWIVERTFGWHMFHRRLIRDFENRPDSSSSMSRIAMINNMLRRITDRKPQPCIISTAA